MRNPQLDWPTLWARGMLGCPVGGVDVGRDHPGARAAGVRAAAEHLRSRRGAGRRPADPERVRGSPAIDGFESARHNSSRVTKSPDQDPSLGTPTIMLRQPPPPQPRGVINLG
jgi:hypothetical protein